MNRASLVDVDCVEADADFVDADEVSENADANEMAEGQKLVRVQVCVEPVEKTILYKSCWWCYCFLFLDS